MVGIAHMHQEDATEVAGLFYRSFRGGRDIHAGFVDYFRDCFFSSPAYDVAQGSLVHRDTDGTIDSALLVMPFEVSVKGRQITARLMSSYMTEPGKRTRGGADMVLTIRARSQELCFTDSATHLSVDHWRAIGGHVMPVTSLNFRRVFRPAGWLVNRARGRLPKWGAAILGALAGPVDMLLRRLAIVSVPSGATGVELSRHDFMAMAPGLVGRFAVHPVWSREELCWLLDMAGRNTVDGPLHLREVRDAKGHLCGASVFYAQPGRVAKVLNILARSRRESAVVEDLLAHLDAMGCLSAEGIAQPFLMESLRRQKGIGFVPRGGFCLSTKHPEIVEAAQRGDFYLGGLAGEDWSRLVTDFHH